MSDFVIDLATLPPGYVRVEVEAAPRELGLPEPEWIAPVRGSLAVERSGERVSVRGTVGTTARLECVRCLAPFDLALSVPFEAFAERTGMSPADEQRELERDAYMLFHDGRRLDLSEQVRETLLVEIPLAPVCREDCAGLCPRCGAELNLGPHQCPAA